MVFGSFQYPHTRDIRGVVRRVPGGGDVTFLLCVVAASCGETERYLKVGFQMRLKTIANLLYQF